MTVRPNVPSFQAALRNRRFLIALGLLFINDFFFKPASPNWITGKLSDFAGLYAFAIFCVSVYPQRRREIVSLIGLFFIWWKSPFSESAIRMINSSMPFHIARVVDLTDLYALIVLPLAARHISLSAIEPKKFTTVVLACFSVFLFCATSQSQRSEKFDTGYYFQQDLPVLRAEFDSLIIREDTVRTISTDRRFVILGKGVFTFPGDTVVFDETFTADLHAVSNDNTSHSMLELLGVSERYKAGISSDDLRNEFESQVINRLPGLVRSKKLWHLPQYRAKDSMVDSLFLMFIGIPSIVLIGIAVWRVRRKKPPTFATWVLYGGASLGLIIWLLHFVAVITFYD